MAKRKKSRQQNSDNLSPMIADFWQKVGLGRPLHAQPTTVAGLKAEIWRSLREELPPLLERQGFARDFGLEESLRKPGIPDAGQPKRQQALIEEYARRIRQVPIGEGFTPLAAGKLGGLNANLINLGLGIVLDGAGLTVHAALHPGHLANIVTRTDGTRLYLDGADGKLGEIQPDSTHPMPLAPNVRSYLLPFELVRQLDLWYDLAIESPLPEGGSCAILQQFFVALGSWANQKALPAIGVGMRVDPGPIGEAFYYFAMENVFPGLFSAISTVLWQAEGTRVNYAKLIERVLRKLRHPRTNQPLYHPTLSPALLRGVLANPDIAHALLRGEKVPAGTPPDLGSHIADVAAALVRGGPTVWGEFPEELAGQFYQRDLGQPLEGEPPSRES